MSRSRHRLSEHFTVEEFDCHDGTRVPQHALADLERLCVSYLEPLRSEFGPVLIWSGYRTRRYNRAVGGVPGSMHIYRATRAGAAADLSCRRGMPSQWFAALDGLAVPGLGAYDSHVHADTRARRARW